MSHVEERVDVVLGACGIGLGHVGRLLPVAEALTQKGLKVVFTTYGDSADICLRKGYTTYRERRLSYGSKEDGSISLKETFRQTPSAFRAFMSQVRSELNVLRKHRPRLVVSDSRLSTLIASRILRIRTVLIMHEFKVVLPIDETKVPGLGFVKGVIERIALELMGLGWDLADIVLIADYPPPLTVCRDSVVVPEFLKHKTLFIGTVSQPRIGLTKDEAKRLLNISGSKPLIYFGLSGLPWERKSMRGKMMDAAKYVSRDGFQVLFSRGEPGGSDRISLSEGVMACDWLPDRRVAYAAADVFVSVGGQTSVGEALRYGLPMVVVPTPNHTEHDQIASSLQSVGVAVKIPFSELTPERMQQAVRTIVEENYAKKSAAVSQAISNYYPVKRIAETVDEFIHG
ncbi:MAG: glycosyltransferase [Thermoprotei archaeon]